MSFGSFRKSDESYKGKECIEYDSKAAPGQTLRFVKKRSAMDRDIWACVGCTEISKRMGAILPIPEITTRRGNFVTDPDNPAPHKHYPLCLGPGTGGSESSTGNGSSGGAAMGRGARKRRSMADVERYEDTSAYDFINAPTKKKKGSKPEGAPKYDPGPSINELGLTQYKGGMCSFIMGPDLNKDIEKGLVVARSQKHPGYVWLYEKLKVKDKSFYRCVKCRNGAEDDGEFHDGYIKQLDRRIFGNPDTGHVSGCKAQPINKVIALGLEREIVQQLEETALTGEGGGFHAAYGAAKLRVAGRCSSFKGKASTVIFALEDWKYEVEGIPLEEMKVNVGAVGSGSEAGTPLRKEKSATPASSTDSRPSSVKPELDEVSNGNVSPATFASSDKPEIDDVSNGNASPATFATDSPAISVAPSE